MKAYCIDAETRIYVGDMTLQLDPLTTKKTGVKTYLKPKDVTLIEPPVLKENEIAKFIDNQWIVEELKEPEKKEEPEKELTEQEIIEQENEALIQAEIRKMAIERLGDKLKKVKESE